MSQEANPQEEAPKGKKRKAAPASSSSSSAAAASSSSSSKAPRVRGTADVGGALCNICYEAYDDSERCPRLLPCGHTFCSSCLSGLLSKMRSNAFECPVDRSSIQFNGSKGVHSLVKNFALLDIIAALNGARAHGRDAPPCSVCPDAHAATVKCTSCDEFMCDIAHAIHARQKATRSHVVASIDEVLAKPRLYSSTGVCPEHMDAYRYYDTQCNVLVCRDCFALGHHGHRCVSIPEAAATARQEIGQLRDRYTVLLTDLVQSRDTVSRAADSLWKDYESARRAVRADFEALRDALTRRESEILAEMKATSNKSSAALHTQLENLDTHSACVESGIEHIGVVLEDGTDIAVISAKADAVATLEAFNSQPVEMEPVAESDMKYSPNVQMLRSIASYGTVNGQQGGLHQPYRRAKRSSGRSSRRRRY